MSKSGLTDEESKLIELTAELWNGYSRLQEQHPSDKEEFCRALHICQHLIMIRAVRRADSDMFPVYGSDEDMSVAKAVGEQIKEKLKKELGLSENAVILEYKQERNENAEQDSKLPD